MTNSTPATIEARRDARGTAELARRFRALGDEKRLLILDLLCDGERCVCELTDALDLKQSLLSFHLRTLKEAGLVRDRREGRWIFYSLAPSALGVLRAHVEALETSDAPASACGAAARESDACCG